MKPIQLSDQDDYQASVGWAFSPASVGWASSPA